MKPLRHEPRCPDHPDVGYNISYGEPARVPVFSCAACHRPMGLVSVHPWSFRRHLRSTDRNLDGLSAVDFEWQFAFQDKHGRR